MSGGTSIDCEMTSTPGLPGPNARYDPRDHQPHIRANDAEREAVSAMVRSALHDGRLALNEVDERLGAVYEAKTHGDLAQVVADIVPYHPPRLVAAQPMVPTTRPGISQKKILPAVVLSIPFGLFGAHRFYAGQTNTAIAMLVLTLIGIGAPITFFWWLADLVRLCMESFRDGNGKVMKDWL